MMTRRELLKLGTGATLAAGLAPVTRLFAQLPAGKSALAIHSYTSGEPAAMSNSYLVSGDKEAFLFDVVQMRHEAQAVVEMIQRSGKELRFVWISHAHPDHFLGLDVIADAFPHVPIYSTEGVVADIGSDGPGLVKVLAQRWGADGPRRLVLPTIFDGGRLTLEGAGIDIHTFSNGESRHLANLHLVDTRQMLTADIVYNRTHLFLREKHIEGWLAQLEEFEEFATKNLGTLYPGHGHPGTAEMVTQTRRYLEEFRAALVLDDPIKVRGAMLAKHADYSMARLLTDYTIPAFFPNAPTSH